MQRNGQDTHIRIQAGATRGTWWILATVKVTWYDLNAEVAVPEQNIKAYSMQLILVWTPGGSSPIHDHSNAHCVMKVLKGSLKETLYSWPDQSTISGGRGSPLQTKKETVYTTNQVTYMSDNVRPTCQIYIPRPMLTFDSQLGLHKISNPDIQEFAVSLHR